MQDPIILGIVVSVLLLFIVITICTIIINKHERDIINKTVRIAELNYPSLDVPADGLLLDLGGVSLDKPKKSALSTLTKPKKTSTKRSPKGKRGK